MPIKGYNPYTSGRRHMTILTRDEITKQKPERSLLAGAKKKTGGRNCYGRRTMRFIGGGHKRRLRIIDFKRDKIGIPGRVAAVEYDPNRTARIALIFYADGEKRYIVCPDQLKVGDTIIAGADADIRPGNAKKFKDMPDGTMVHNIELEPGRGAKLARSAGVSAQLMAREGKFAFIRMPSGEIRKILLECMATIGVVGNGDHANVSLGKAGKSRWLGRKGHVRGMHQNPCDHPMGGGQGVTKSHRHPCSPWGTLAKGYRTRKRKTSDKFIVRRRYVK